MAYLDEDILYNNIEEKYKVAKGVARETYSDVLDTICEMPRADVAPKSEVAREIFEEILRTVFPKIPNKIMLITKEQDFSDGVVFGKREAFLEMINILAELKKKYLQENAIDPQERWSYTLDILQADEQKNKQQTVLENVLNRCAKLETLLFDFVWNRAIYPLGQRLGKNEDEIADKVLETMEAAEQMVDIPKVRERLLTARQRREEKGEVHIYEETGEKHS